MKRKKVIILISILFFLFIVFFEIEKKNDIKQNNIVEESQEEIIPTTYSRISFFLTSPISASLSIPDYWEGNYRKEESEKSVVFYYIIGGNKKIELFRLFISNFKEKDGKIKYSDDNLILYFKKAPKENLQNSNYNTMYNNIENIISSLKVKK